MANTTTKFAGAALPISASSTGEKYFKGDKQNDSRDLISVISGTYIEFPFGTFCGHRIPFVRFTLL
jgi:hypothetical protein